MWLTRLSIVNIKSFGRTPDIEFSRNVNILVGPNNSGKSTLLRAIYRPQNESALGTPVLKVGESGGSITLEFTGLAVGDPGFISDHDAKINPNATVRAEYQFGATAKTRMYRPGHLDIAMPLSNRSPSNVFHPFFSKRKVAELSQEVNSHRVLSIVEDFSALVAKVDRLRERENSLHDEFDSTCRHVLGFPISTFITQSGKQIGLAVGNDEHVPIDQMGEGTAHLVAFIVSLCGAENKIFLIEEIENDIHPLALKALLQLIISKSHNNQFFLSTHSNIVLKVLGAEASTGVFALSMERKNRVPTSSIRGLTDPSDRRSVLSDLGYEMSDYDLWEAWLLLEESSAERIIRDFLIPWFQPKLRGRLRTIAAGGSAKVEPTFEDFRRLFLFTHLQPAYNERAWVAVDGDGDGRNLIEQLRTRYPSWPPEHFAFFSKPAFEHYYPAEFKDKAQAVLKTVGKQELRNAKEGLVKDVVRWIEEDDERAKLSFSNSANEIIDYIRAIAKVLSLETP